MAIQDSIPERRNLLLISLCFIIFFLGGGSFPKDEIRLLVISVCFSRPEVLGIIVWLVFFWFLYRYWVVHRHLFLSEYREEINKLRDKPFFRKFIERTIGRSLALNVAGSKPNETGMVVEWLRWHEGCLKASVMEIRLSRGELGIISARGPVEGGLSETISLKGFVGRFVTLRLAVECIVEQPSFSSYIVPYLVPLFAFALGINEYVL